jgi:hypothetical protein
MMAIGLGRSSALRDPWAVAFGRKKLKERGMPPRIHKYGEVGVVTHSSIVYLGR